MTYKKRNIRLSDGAAANRHLIKRMGAALSRVSARVAQTQTPQQPVATPQEDDPQGDLAASVLVYGSESLAADDVATRGVKASIEVKYLLDRGGGTSEVFPYLVVTSDGGKQVFFRLVAE